MHSLNTTKGNSVVSYLSPSLSSSKKITCFPLLLKTTGRRTGLKALHFSTHFFIAAFTPTPLSRGKTGKANGKDRPQIHQVAASRTVSFPSCFLSFLSLFLLIGRRRLVSQELTSAYLWWRSLCCSHSDGRIVPLELLSLIMAAQIGGARRLVTLLLVLVWLACARGLSISRQRLEVRKHLKRLNKPAVKSIKVPFLLAGSEIFIHLSTWVNQWCFFFLVSQDFFWVLFLATCFCLVCVGILDWWITYFSLGTIVGCFFGGWFYDFGSWLLCPMFLMG